MRLCATSSVRRYRDTLRMQTNGGVEVPEPTHVSIRLPKDLYDAVSDLAHKEERSVTAEIRRVLKGWLSQQPAQKTT